MPSNIAMINAAYYDVLARDAFDAQAHHLFTTLRGLWMREKNNWNLIETLERTVSVTLDNCSNSAERRDPWTVSTILPMSSMGHRRH